MGRVGDEACGGGEGRSRTGRARLGGVGERDTLGVRMDGWIVRLDG